MFQHAFQHEHIGRISSGPLPARDVPAVGTSVSSTSKVGEKLSSGPLIRRLSKLLDAMPYVNARLCKYAERNTIARTWARSQRVMNVREESEVANFLGTRDSAQSNLI